MPETRSRAPLVWIDCEMTGLDPDSDTILSIACFITDSNLDLLEEQGHMSIIHHNRQELNSMNEWCIEHHGASGLTEAAFTSRTTAQEAAESLLIYIKKHVGKPWDALLAGNSVHVDKQFLHKKPYSCITDYLHYRILDVSVIKEAARRWAPDGILKNTPKKKSLHDARADILESIEEARYYRQTLFLTYN